MWTEYMYGSFHFHSPWIHFSVEWISVHRNLLKGQRNGQGVPQTKSNLSLYIHYIRKCNNLKNTRLCKGKLDFFYRFYALKPIKRYKIEQLIFKCKYDEYFIQLDTNTGHQPKFQRHFDSCSLSSMLCS